MHSQAVMAHSVPIARLNLMDDQFFPVVCLLKPDVWGKTFAQAYKDKYSAHVGQTLKHWKVEIWRIYVLISLTDLLIQICLGI